MSNNNSYTIDNCTFKNIGSLAIWMGKKLVKERKGLLGILSKDKSRYIFKENKYEAGKKILFLIAKYTIQEQEA
jgi:hypothetical protein